MSEDNRSDEELWFEEGDEDSEAAAAAAEGSSEPTGSPLEGMTPIAGGVLGGRAAAELLRRLGLGGGTPERKREGAEERRKEDELIGKAALLAKEKDIEELNELYLEALTARIMMSHCPDCMEQLKESMIKTIRDMPMKSIIKYKEKYGIEGED